MTNRVTQCEVNAWNDILGETFTIQSFKEGLKGDGTYGTSVEIFHDGFWSGVAMMRGMELSSKEVD